MFWNLFPKKAKRTTNKRKKKGEMCMRWWDGCSIWRVRGFVWRIFVQKIYVCNEIVKKNSRVWLLSAVRLGRRCSPFLPPFHCQVNFYKLVTKTCRRNSFPSLFQNWPGNTISWTSPCRIWYRYRRRSVYRKELQVISNIVFAFVLPSCRVFCVFLF